MNCKPNQRCLIVGAPRGAEENIGALVTTVSYERGFRSDCGKPLMMWLWENASRPLLSASVLSTGEPFNTYTSDGKVLYQGHVLYHGIRDEHLMPIEDDETPEADEVRQEETRETGVPA